jgi:ABC-2 type transport system ATP-binding protein
MSAIPALPVAIGPNEFTPVVSRAARAPAIDVAGLTKRFSVRRGMTELLRFRPASVSTVVSDVSFEVGEGEVVGLLGPNGAGKTTIFKMLSTMVLPDDGTALVCGNDIWLEPAAVRGALAAVSSDERSLNWRLSARENLLLFAALQKVPRGNVERRLAETLASVGLESTGRKMVAAFSSGMRQRLLIARALLAEPRVLLLDEPTRALDPISAQEFRVFLRRELVERHRCTILLATHNADEALSFCDRVVVLHQGRVLAEGTATALAARFGEEHYRILTTTPDHLCFDRLESLDMLRRVGGTSTLADGWHVVECSIPGDPSRSAGVLRALLDAGVTVARLERIELSLADLIRRIISARTERTADA